MGTSWCLLSAIAPLAAAGQDSSPSDSASYRPFLSVGLSQFVGDFGEDNDGSLGPMIRGGLRFPGSAVGLSFSYWPDVNRFRLASLQLDFVQDLTERRRITPNLIVGVGHTWGRFLGTGPANEPTGGSAAAGLGVKAHLTDRLTIDTDVRLRTDDYGWNGEWRLFAEMAPASVLASASGRRTSFFTSWMAEIEGPWVTVAPSFGLRVSQDDGVLTVQMAHWQIPREGPSGGYVWDTRSVIAAAQTQRDLIDDRLFLRVGPAISAMGEGPDNGVNFGGQVDVALVFDVGSAHLEAGLGYLWLNRSSSSYPSDQRGLMFSVGVGG